MIKLVLTEVIEALRGEPGATPRPVTVAGVSSDSRTAQAGELFFALHGPRHDGHDHAADALARGAVAAVVARSKGPELVRRGVDPARLILVDEPLAALARLASFHRRQAPADVIAVAGSNGKTTTKEMIGHILSERLRGRCSPKSYNNAIGVPLTLLSTEAADDFLVVEIGTNAPGEVAQLGELVEPDMAVVTSVGEEHLERLGDLEGVAAEECSVLRRVRRGGFAAVNIDSPYVRPHVEACGLKVATFGVESNADLRITRVAYDAPWLNFELNGRFAYPLHKAGAHNASNAAGAIAIARRLGFEHEQIAARLESFTPPPMRGEVLRLGAVTLVNDAYNSNPHSALAAIGLLKGISGTGRRVAVFGEMRELGENSAAQHARVAQRLRDERVDHVILVGPACELMGGALRGGDLFSPTVECVGDVEACAERLGRMLRDGDVVLLKASRAVGLERLVEPLRRRFADGTAS